MPDSIEDQQAEFSKSRANACFLLARLWSHEVASEYLKNLIASPLGGAYRQAGGWLPTKTELCQELDVELANDFRQCFLGPENHLPPFQSVADSSRSQAQCCDSLQEFAKVIGPIQAQGFKSQPMHDHASLELAMMGQVQLSIYASLELEDHQAAKELQEVAETFYTQHLDWLIKYCDVVNARSQTSFYRGLFKVTKEFLESEFKKSA